MKKELIKKHLEICGFNKRDIKILLKYGKNFRITKEGKFVVTMPFEGWTDATA